MSTQTLCVLGGTGFVGRHLVPRLHDAGHRVRVLDPPALVKSGKHLAAGARAYRELNRMAMGLLQEDGYLVTCTCSHHLDDALFRQVLVESARAAHRPFRVVDWRNETNRLVIPPHKVEQGQSDQVTTLTHKMEDILNKLRKAELVVTAEIMALRLSM